MQLMNLLAGVTLMSWQRLEGTKLGSGVKARVGIQFLHKIYRSLYRIGQNYRSQKSILHEF